jgi:ABC-2 type transport system ATP-binding protein
MLRIRNIHKSYGRVKAVDGLSLTVEGGEVVGLLGPNGAGKSTTISIAVGLVLPDSGEVVVGGRGSPSEPAVRAMMGLAPQAVALYEDLTAGENLECFGRLHGLDRAARRSAAASALDRVGLTDRARDRVKTYSGGMKRRLNLATALLHNPKLVLLDEPTAGVDPQSRSSIIDLVRSLRDEGRAVIYTTHYMEEAQRVCDRVEIVDHGRVIAAGSPDDLIGLHGGASVITIQTADSETRFETNDPVAELNLRLRDPGVMGVRIDRPDLESVFLRLTGRSLRD